MTGVLLKAISAGRPRQVRLLLDSGIPLATVDTCGKSPLIRAIFVDEPRTREKLVMMLLRAGAHVSHVDITGRSALLWACAKGRDREVALLLRHGDVDLNLNHSDINGQTGLHLAVISDNAIAVKLMVNALMKFKLSIDITDNTRMSPLMHAIRLGYDACAEILLQQGGASAGRNMKDPNEVLKWASFPSVASQHIPMSSRKKLQQGSLLPDILHACQGNDQYKNDVTRRLIRDSYEDDSSTESETDSCETRATSRGDSASSIDERPSTSSTYTVSTPTSTNAIVDPSDDDVDDFSTALSDSTCTPQRILPQLYKVYESQYSKSYRNSAKIREIKNALRSSQASLTDQHQVQDSGDTLLTPKASGKNTPSFTPNPGNSGLRHTQLQMKLKKFKQPMLPSTPTPLPAISHVRSTRGFPLDPEHNRACNATD